MGVATTNGPAVGSYWPPHHTHTLTYFILAAQKLFDFIGEKLIFGIYFHSWHRKKLSLQLFFWGPPIPLERNYTKKIIYGLLNLALVSMPLNDFG